MDGGLLDVSGDAGDECISVLKVGVEVGLWEDEIFTISYKCVHNVYGYTACLCTCVRMVCP